MTTSTKSRKATKTVQVLSRTPINDKNVVVYMVQSSRNPHKTYDTTLINGKATGCTCRDEFPYGNTCYHMTQLETIEQNVTEDTRRNDSYKLQAALDEWKFCRWCGLNLTAEQLAERFGCNVKRIAALIY